MDSKLTQNNHKLDPTLTQNNPKMDISMKPKLTKKSNAKLTQSAPSFSGRGAAAQSCRLTHYTQHNFVRQMFLPMKCQNESNSEPISEYFKSILE